jgi:hypothetical protein
MWFEAAVTEMNRADLQLRLHDDLKSARAILANPRGCSSLSTMIGAWRERK